MAHGEICDTCPLDCGICPYCGDGGCDWNETCVNCEWDCGECPTCGSVSGTIFFDGAVGPDDLLSVGLSQVLPGTPQLEVLGPQFPFDYTIADVAVGTYYVVAALDVGNDSPGEPGPEDYFGVYKSMSNLFQVVVGECDNLTGIDFTLESAP